MKKPKKRGRKPSGLPIRAIRLNVRLTKEEFLVIKGAAFAAQVAPSTYARESTLKLARTDPSWTQKS